MVNRGTYFMRHDSCDVYVREIIEGSAIAEYIEKILYKDIPCTLTYKTSHSSLSGDEKKTAKEIAVLLVEKDYNIPLGSKIVVRKNSQEQTFIRSGIQRIYSRHKEIPVEIFERWI